MSGTPLAVLDWRCARCGAAGVAVARRGDAEDQARRVVLSAAYTHAHRAGRPPCDDPQLEWTERGTVAHRSGGGSEVRSRSRP